MLDTVLTYLGSNRSVFTDIPAIGDKLIELQSAHDTISAKEDFQISIIVASSYTKAEARRIAETAGTALAGILYNYGIKTGNGELISKYDVNISQFSKMRDVSLIILLNSVKEEASRNIAKLAQYGLNDSLLEEHVQKFNSYFASASAKESNTAMRKSANKEITDIFYDADKTLREIDKLVESFRDKHREFFNGYKAARAIKDVGVKRKALPEAIQTQSTQ